MLSSTREKALLRAIGQEVNTFFTQMRDSGLVSRLMGYLTRAHSEVHQKVAEQFVFLCWTRHSDLVVQELLEATREHLAMRRMDEALAALDEVPACRRACVYAWIF